MLQKIKIDKELVRERFSRTLSSYAANAVVQKAMARELIDMICLEKQPPVFERVLEVGAGSGLLLNELFSRCTVKDYYANDLVEESLPCLRQVIARFSVEKFRFLAGDIETLDVLPASLDLVVSSATLQWLDDLDDFFRKISDHLKPGGIFAFSTFGTSNMLEIASIEDVGLSYHSLGEIEILASRYFDLISSREREQRLEFNTPEDVLHHIRKTGVNGLLRRAWTKSRYQHFIAEYHRLFSCEKGVSLTYHPLYCCMKKKIS